MSIHISSILELDDLHNEITWNDDDYSKFSSLFLTNNRLFNVLKRIGYKAAIGVAVTLIELIQKRSKKLFPFIDVTKEFDSKIESLWAGAIDPLYLKTWDYGDDYYDENGDATVYAADWYIMYFLINEYMAGTFCVHRYLVNLSMIARHLTPDKKLFDKWFAEIIRKTSEEFPCTYDYADLNFDDKDAKYDCSVDAPIPREFFFDPEFKYSEETAKSVLNIFLQSLDYNNNPWLCTPEEMLKKGFKGTPYKVE